MCSRTNRIMCVCACDYGVVINCASALLPDKFNLNATISLSPLMFVFCVYLNLCFITSTPSPRPTCARWIPKDYPKNLQE